MSRTGTSWLRRLRALLGGPSPAHREEPQRAEERDDDPDPDDEMPASDLVVELPITDALDLHPFRPNETADVVRDYLEAVVEKGLREVRIIHGRGIGTQREIVRRVLSRDPRVVSFADAPADRGGWGATVVQLRSDPESGEQR
jgi:dsDNA-specific endonuclease/ATPase MutS2